MDTLQIPTLPYLIIMVPQETDQGIAFGGSPYDKKQFGAFKFNNLMKSVIKVMIYTDSH